MDAVENAEVAEIKRAVFRALTRLRAALGGGGPGGLMHSLGADVGVPTSAGGGFAMLVAKSSDPWLGKLSGYRRAT